MQVYMNQYRLMVIIHEPISEADLSGPSFIAFFVHQNGKIFFNHPRLITWLDLLPIIFPYL